MRSSKTLRSSIRVCLKIGYIPNYSHLIGIMISKTIGFRGTLFSDIVPIGETIFQVFDLTCLKSNPGGLPYVKIAYPSMGEHS